MAERQWQLRQAMLDTGTDHRRRARLMHGAKQTSVSIFDVVLPQFQANP